MHRHSPLASSFWAQHEAGTVVVAPGRLDDHRRVLDMVERFEGPVSAALAARWLDAQPENLWVVSSPTGSMGWAFHSVCPADPGLSDDDPVVLAALDEVARTSPARQGEQVSVGRFFAGETQHQRDPYAVIAGSVSSTLLWTSRPLAWSFVATVDPDFWGPIFDYLALTTRRQAEYAGLHFTLFGIDWRRLPVDVWFELLGEREVTGESGPPPERLLRPPPLPRAEFADAVRSSLRDVHRPDRLRASILMGSRLALGYDGASPETLLATVLAGVDQVGREPRGDSLQRVLDRTFVHAAPSQEAAAEVLGLPFSTYRRHLVRAIERLTDILWAVEIGEAQQPMRHIGQGLSNERPGG
jgi:hypothetical protein